MNSECHSMIMEYLVHHCYKNTAKALLNETTKLNNVSCGSTKKSKKGNLCYSNGNINCYSS